MSANDILFQYESAGASQLTAWTQSRELKDKKIVGVEASNVMAQEDLPRLKKYAAAFLAAGRTHNVPPALLAAIASRESRAGTALDKNGWGLYDSNGFGIMQVDRQNSPKGGPFSSEHVNQAASLLRKAIDEVKANHGDWAPALQLRGGVAGYNFGADDVWTIPGMDKGTTGNDYSSDVWARARYLAPDFGGGKSSKADNTVTELPDKKKDSTPLASKGSPVVRDVQLLLIKYGYMTVEEVKTGPGILGPKTKAAIERFVAERSQPGLNNSDKTDKNDKNDKSDTIVSGSGGALADGISVNANDPILKKLATQELKTGETSSCVRTTLNNMARLGIKDIPAATAGDGNHSRGAMAQMMLNGKWESLPLVGSRSRVVKSTYGTVTVYVTDASAYKKMALAGQIPSGAIIFQTKHGWDYGAGPYGNDMGIVRDGGRVTFNFKSMPPIIYRAETKEIVLLVPKGAIVRGEPSKRRAS
jgi:hypothetical protein